MSYFINNQQKVNELIFANRNKNYGAYVLRNDYGYTLMGSLFFTALLVGTIASAAYYLSNRANIDKPDNGGQVLKNERIYTILYEPKDLKDMNASPKKTPSTKMPASTTKDPDNSFDIKDSVYENNNTQLLNTNITSNQSTYLNGSGNNTKGSGSDSSSLGNNGGKGEEKKIKKDVEVDSAPEFEGGLAALYSFIGKNLHYPVEAAEEGRGGTVYVNFVVDETGKIEQISLLNKKGFGLDEEALRVVHLLPKFKSPAKVKGEAVKVYFQLPIKFVLK